MSTTPLMRSRSGIRPIFLAALAAAATGVVRGSDPAQGHEVPPRRSPPASPAAAAGAMAPAASPDPPRKSDGWSFQPLHPSIPPTVRTRHWARNPIDAYILSGLESAGLEPSPEANRRTLVRRASLDLLGLPPDPESAEEFVQNPSPDAWPRLVTRLLDNPRFGERWARHWLDIARFAESSGFEHDTDRPSAYHYRDFVIRAFNEDLPFDQFVRWQLAGDEFEPETPLALMATGFLGAGVFPTQITANEVERTRYDALDDMLSTAGSAFLGLTIGCARCHDHKYDPIPTRDYYRMLSIFTSTVRSEVELDLNPEETRRTQAEHERGRRGLLDAQLGYEQQVLPGRFEHWLATGAQEPAPAWALPGTFEIQSKAGAKFRSLEDGSHLAEGRNADSDVYTLHAEVPTPGIRALRLEALSDVSLPRGGPGRADNGNFGLSRIRIFSSPISGGPTNELRIASARATFEQNTGPLSIASALDDDPKTGWAVDPRFGTNHAAVFEFSAPPEGPGGVRLTIHLEFEVNTRHHIGRPRMAVSTSPHPPLDGEPVPPQIPTLLAIAQAQSESPQWPAGGKDQLREWWKRRDPGWSALQSRLNEYDRNAPQPKRTRVLVCAEGYPALRMNTQGADFFPETYFLQRGSTDLKSGVAAPGYLHALPGGSVDESRWNWQPPRGARFSGRRRALATWMTDVDRGAGALLARVIVNRLWQHHFGRGLVATPNDFGAQGARPSHPELLDWLAGELIRSGWRLKHIHALILTSATYRQSVRPPQEGIDPDPGNAYWGRWVPRRLEGEVIRDSLLHISGCLDSSMQGPGTRDLSSRRRSIYFTVKRSELIPVLQAFDAPEPLVSQGTRPVTTVAPQALFLMNSPQIRDWAAHLARRIDPDPTAPLVTPITRAYGFALNRAPVESEQDDAIAYVGSQEDRHRAAGHSDPRGAALTDFAQVVLCLNECIYVE
ncbi:MAG: DUF1549 domain-containing protein [Verrucomicrobiales bacterium]|nr:DUF1549 domain-containing protein [Verrucomicrobiales bacterium]